MAQVCSSSSLAVNFSSLSSSSSSSSISLSYSKILSFPFRPLLSRKLKIRSSLYAPQYYAPPEKGSRSGIWSIRDDLQVPSSPYFPAYAQSAQGPPPMVQERFMSVISQLFQYRIIRCGGAVDDDMANIIVAQLLYLDAVDPTKDIVMYVNSPGGSVTAGMAVFDTMRHIRPDVSTVCVGLAASMGAFLLSGGTKGKRYSLPNSRIMIHQPLGGAQGGQTDIDIQANEMLHHKANLNGYLAYHTGQSLEKINQDTDRDFFMSAKEAKDYGLIDGVISNPLKAFQPLAAAAEEKDVKRVYDNINRAKDQRDVDKLVNVKLQSDTDTSEEPCSFNKSLTDFHMSRGIHSCCIRSRGWMPFEMKEARPNVVSCEL